jgi:(5-formylfuran-3-yl)methyl phosphate synthase
MRLLVSVRGPVEARAARRGGADVIDAKDPAHGALGPVRGAALAAICRAAGAAHPVSAALGDVGDEGDGDGASVVGRAAAAARLGVAFVKVGFGGIASERWARRFAGSVRRGVGAETGVVLVAYADWRAVAGLVPERIVTVAADVGARGVLLDTARKGATLFALMPPDHVARWVGLAHAAGLFAALAGGLRGADFATARALGAELVGVRGAACVGGRLGRVSANRVARLKALTLSGTAPRGVVGVLA